MTNHTQKIIPGTQIYQVITCKKNLFNNLNNSLAKACLSCNFHQKIQLQCWSKVSKNIWIPHLSAGAVKCTEIDIVALTGRSFENTRNFAKTIPPPLPDTYTLTGMHTFLSPSYMGRGTKKRRIINSNLCFSFYKD